MSGFLFWAALLLVLEPDNLLRAADAGVAMGWPRETLRIVGASVLGAAASPAVVLMARRFPVGETRRVRHGLLHLLGAAFLAAVLITGAHVLARAFLDGAPCTLEAIRRDLAANGALVTLWLLVFDGLVHAVRHGRDSRRTAVGSSAPAFFQVRDRGALTLISARDIDWVEAQGNYVALHVGESCHLHREALASFQAKVDPDSFVRVHRGSLVALSKIVSVRRLPSGDALARLSTGRDVRVSRTYAKSLLDRWDVPPSHGGAFGAT